MDYGRALWDWVSSPSNKETLTWFSGGVTAVAAGLWGVFKFLRGRPSTTVKVDRGVAAGRNINGSTITTHSPSSVNLGGEGGKAPGAGGGGGGAIGDGAKAGDGGDGGECVSRIINLAELKKLQLIDVTVGEGGTGACLPGQHGKSGGDTVLNFLAEDGTVLETLRAPGGPGGKSGTARLPRGDRSLAYGYYQRLPHYADGSERCGTTRRPPVYSRWRLGVVFGSAYSI